MLRKTTNIRRNAGKLVQFFPLQCKLTLETLIGLGQLSRYSDALGSGDLISVGARFFGPVQTGLGFQPASYATGTGFLSRRQAGRGVALTTHPYLAPRVKKEQSYNSSPPLGLCGLLRGDLSFSSPSSFAQQPNAGQGRLFMEVRHHSRQDSSGRATGRRDLHLTTHNTHKRQTSMSQRDSNRNPSKRSAAKPRLTLLGHQNGKVTFTLYIGCIYKVVQI